MPELKGIVFVVDGAGGSGFLPYVMKGLLSGSQYQMEHFHWSAGYMRIIKDLTNRENNRKRASDLGRLIADYRAKQPDHSIHLIGKCAGAAIALWAMADLEKNTLDRVILLSPAVSSTFPLATAIPAARREVYSFWSPNDLFFLGLGTSLFGTADGVYGKSAGLIGFSPAAGSVAGSQVPHAGLKEVRWSPSMISSLHIGDHSGTSMPPFIRKYVLPLLAQE